MLTQEPSANRLFTRTEGKSVFFAAPMSSFGSNDDYQQSREAILDVAEHLSKQHRFSSVYYAGSSISSQAHFTSNNLAMQVDLQALREANLFILLYPARLLSSVLVEAGYAMAYKKPMLLMVKNRDDLPYFFREAEQVVGDKDLPRIEIQEYQDYRDLSKIIDDSIPRLL
jgi:nucleoside 2-deoxyribosyltransferase